MVHGYCDLSMAPFMLMDLIGVSLNWRMAVLFQPNMTINDLEALRNELLNLERALRALAEEAERNQWMRLAANIEFAADRIERAIGILNDRIFANVRLGE